jgi:hypothetical protein
MNWTVIRIYAGIFGATLLGFAVQGLFILTRTSC